MYVKNKVGILSIFQSNWVNGQMVKLAIADLSLNLEKKKPRRDRKCLSKLGINTQYPNTVLSHFLTRVAAYNLLYILSFCGEFLVLVLGASFRRHSGLGGVGTLTKLAD